MQRPLDPHSFKQNTYERPNQEWICGRAADGHPCPLGPGQRGQCRATGECLPVRKGDRWACTRLDAFGGKCEQGPRPDGACCHPVPPCQPVRSLHRLRRMTVSLVLSFTVGVLFYLLGGKGKDRWLDPGELSAVHGTSAGHGATAANCGDCHSVHGTKPGETAPASVSNRRLADSQLCLKCHTFGGDPLQAHAANAPKLADLTRKAQKVKSDAEAPLVLQVSRKISGIDPHGGQLACATCHHEHRGRDASLTQLSDAQCQVCHTLQFASFEQGHPQFSPYPFKRRTRIFFDHMSHFRQHFGGEKKALAPVSCQGCHTTEASGRLMLVQDFQQSCAACHAGQIKGEGMTNKGLAFFSVPELDVDTLESKGHRIGEWPRADGKLTPFMELLLGTDAGLRAALDKLRGVELFDLSKASADQLDAADQLAWAVKSLLFDLATGGHEMLLKKLGANLSADRSRLPSELTGRMSSAALLAAQQEWMPHLLTEMPDYRKGIKPPAPKPPVPAPATAAPPKPVPPVGNDDILDVSPSPTAPKPKKPTAGDDSILDAGDLRPAPNPPVPLVKGPPRAADDLSSPGGPDDLLKAAAPPGKDKAAPTDAGDLLSTIPTTPPPKAAGGDQSPAAEPKPAEDWMAAGGWYRTEKSFTLFYRPAGHADTFVAAWLTVAAGMPVESPFDVARAAFRKLADPEAPGACMKCHTVDAEGGVMRVNWLPAQPVPHAHPFTVFSHTAHFSLLTDVGGCQTCHRLDPRAEYAKAFAPADGSLPDDPARFASNFTPISKAVCAECHTPQIARDNCLLCHRYHTGTFAPTVREAASFHTPADRSNDVGHDAVNGDR